MEINLRKLIPGSKYFRWKEFLWCPQWKVYVFPTDRQYLNILKFAPKLDKVREFMGVAMISTSGLRPGLYNELIGGSKGSAHLRGRAWDGVFESIPSKEARIMLVPKLEEFGLRMENLETPHVHLDDSPVGKDRYFIPY